MKKEEIGIDTSSVLVNKFSGMIGITGVSSDMREIEEAAWKKGNERAQLGLKMYSYRVAKYIGAYAAAMNGVDIIIFTGGIGENGPETRKDICKHLEFMGVDFVSEQNDGKRGKEVTLTSKDSKVAVMVVPTDEELVIAQDTKEIIATIN